MFAIFFITPQLGIMMNVPSLKRFYLRWNGFQTHRTLATVYKLKDHLNTWKRPKDVHELRIVLDLVRNLQAKDPLDRLYSLYTIMQGFCPDFPKPNYRISPAVLWASATLAIIQSTRCLDLILDVHHDERDDRLPSWSFDWGLQSENHSKSPWDAADDTLLRQRPVGTAWDKPPKIELDHDISGFRPFLIKGKIHSKVEKRSLDQKEARDWVRNTYSTLENPDVTVEYQNAMGGATQILFEWAIPKGGAQPPTDIDEQELCRHLLIWADIPEQDSSKAFETWYPEMKRLQWIQADESLNEPDDSLASLIQFQLSQQHGKGLATRFHEQLCFRRLFRCFFVTSDGRMGDAFHTVREGDLVVLLCWSKVPAIIRPQSDDPSLYTLVGFAYVQGLVDCHAWDLKEEELQEFTLV
jgi:hypothetical protein